ncbi:sugar phosphate isomerase/epimerase family protein [Sphingobium sp. CAP-1]|uniref:sugar phosphate isomerase/epimerase family protein n=1 Tax=Sphingobium sp. CAP-1 TaxID=2676077 RepID=UPI0012BB3BA7|nr:sugar phosphate isomerase/epimerase family protein [Sphingobium sp. CAP-1]QGP80522.1 TIM barrel protein [Sphingobium sp. CAP-1]
MTDVADSFCLDHLSLVDLDALTLIDAAASAGFTSVGLFVTPVPISPTPDLVADRAARTAVVSALRDTGLGVGIVEPFMLDATPDWPMLERSAALAADLGGMVNILGLDPDRGRLMDSLGRMVELCRRMGAPAIIETYPLSAIATPGQALALAEELGPDVGLCIDSLHIIRSGGGWADIAALPPDRIRYVQLNDGPLEPPIDRVEEAVFNRLLPGEGAFDLRALLPLLPGHATVAAEAPSRALRSLAPRERAARLMQAMRNLYDDS